MTETAQLFGKPIFGSEDQTLAEQICRILLDEIRAERWKLGDRLPGIMALAKGSGISSWPIHRAYELLQERGILRLEGRRGAFLISLGEMEMQAYGLILPSTGLAGPQLFEFPRIATEEILRQAVERSAVIEVLQLREKQDTSMVDLRHKGPFSERVRGIISLVPFSHPFHDVVPPERIPLVFQGPYISDSLPAVTGDTFHGMYRLTRQVIGEGHRQIALVSSNHLLSNQAYRERIRGFESAMSEASLSYDKRIFEKTSALSFDDLDDLRQLLRSHSHITAWMCLMPYPAQQLATAAESIGLRIPDDISMACFGETSITKTDPKRRMASYGPDNQQIVRNCFEVLEEQHRQRRCTHSLILVKPLFYNGHSLGEPRDAVAPGNGRSVAQEPAAIA